MIATHTMKINGVIYRVGEEIPSPAEVVEEKPKSEPIEVVKPDFTKSEIMLMKVAKLREVANEYGIENPDDYTGTELKDMLIQKFGL